MKTILVPVDLSAAAARVCDAACDLARRTGARLELLHVVQPPPVILGEVYALQPAEVEDLLAAAERTAGEGLRRLAARCEKRGAKTRIKKLVGFPVPAILAEARKADLVVLGTHGHGAVYDFLVGSTTHGVLKRARRPVLVVPVGEN